MIKVLITATPIYGHVAPLVAIGADLSKRGYAVTFLTGASFADVVQQAGVDFVPFGDGIELSEPQWADYVATRAALPPGPLQLDLDIQRLFAGAMSLEHDAIQEQLTTLCAGGNNVVVQHDTTFTGMWPILLGAPGIRPVGTIGIGVIPLTITSADTAPFGLGLPPDATTAGRVRNAEMNAGVTQLFSASQSFVDGTLAALGATTPAPFHMDAMVNLPDRFLQPSPAGVEYPRSDAPSGLRFIGTLPASTEDWSLPDWWAEVQEAARVVVVTQGTLANHDMSELIEPTLEALADMEVLVVVTTGRDDAVVRNVPANARIASYIPYSALLPLTTVLVTNGGYGGALQALTHGVPLVLAGDTEEKVETTARLGWTNSAINLATGHPTAGAIRDAVTKVLTDDSFRLHAELLAKDNATHNPFDEIAATVEELGTVRA